MKTKQFFWILGGGLFYGIIGSILGTIGCIVILLYSTFIQPYGSPANLIEHPGEFACLIIYWLCFIILFYSPLAVLLGGYLTWKLLKIQQQAHLKKKAIFWGAILGAFSPNLTLLIIKLFFDYSDHSKDAPFSYLYNWFAEGLWLALLGAIAGAIAGRLLSRLINKKTQ